MEIIERTQTFTLTEIDMTGKDGESLIQVHE
jgi:hypothetical protein